jgi:MFS family permease
MTTNPQRSDDSKSKTTALRFVVLVGFVSLFADVTYEGARSITGPYLAVLGAGATVVGVVAGLGELLGYGLRLVSGFVSDRTRQYWVITIVGYAINLFAVPALALAGSWELAAALIITERVGKAIRTPARDAMLSHATTEMGRGWGFGLHEAMDQAGATLGPLIIAATLYFKEGYRTGFAVLLVPAVIAMCVLITARLLYPKPSELEPTTARLATKGFTSPFWIYVIASALVAAGFADFPLLAYHFQKTARVSPIWIPIFYSLAMGVDALAALVLGRLFDRLGLVLLAFISLLSALFAPLVFLGGFGLALVGVAVWGVGMGSQESIMRAAVAAMVPRDRRASAYGIFNAAYGVLWFLGSALMGFFYDRSVMTVVAFAVIMQLASVPIFLLAGNALKARS